MLMHTVTGLCSFMGGGGVSSGDINFIVIQGLESRYGDFARRDRWVM